ncbi:hypothetical protein FHR92_000735 [Fontibacillus solani]|uniref:Uncharacterized protein n=1 Tax=Fontibacillus solani TaxID=1572857 RepID=A0A7W3SQD1_9BACL|nr:hypothetical protein [Fontibacillus solani]
MLSADFISGYITAIVINEITIIGGILALCTGLIYSYYFIENNVVGNSLFLKQALKTLRVRTLRLNIKK